MRYAQIKSGKKLHLICEAGEVYWGEIIRKDHQSAPLCKTSAFHGNYRMTINVPLGNACKNCLRVYNSGKCFQKMG